MAKPGTVCVPVDGMGLPLDRGLIDTHGGGGTPAAGTLAYFTECGSAANKCQGYDYKVASCGAQLQTSCKAKTGVDGVGSCGGTVNREVCRRAVFPGWNTRPGIRSCCMDPKLGPRNGCGWLYCPGSDVCMESAEHMCTQCRNTLSPTSVDDPCNPAATGPVFGAVGDQLCASLRPLDFQRWKNMMQSVCLRPDGGPNENTRLSGCLAFLNDPEVQAGGTRLQEWCRQQPVQPASPQTGDATPLDDDLCGCYRAPAFYDQFVTALSQQWVVPEGLLDPRPICLYPGCRAALVQDRSRLTPDAPCKPTSIATCVQRVSVTNEGQITGGIAIDQSCPAGSGLQPRGGAAACSKPTDCTGGQVCDLRRGACANPGDLSLECTTPGDCAATGQECGPEPAADGKRYCRARTTAPPGAGPVPAGYVVLAVVGGLVVAAALAWVLRWLLARRGRRGPR